VTSVDNFPWLRNHRTIPSCQRAAPLPRNAISRIATPRKRHSNENKKAVMSARKPRDAAGVLFGLKFADNIHYKIRNPLADPQYSAHHGFHGPLPHISAGDVI